MIGIVGPSIGLRGRRRGSGGAAPPPAYPSTLGLATWLESDTGVSTSSGFATAWANQGSGSPSYSTGTVSRQPAVLANAFNGLPVLSFDGVDDMLEADNATTVPPSSCAIVARILTGCGANRGIYTAAPAGLNDYDNGVLWWNSGHASGMPSGADTWFQGGLINNSNLPLDAWYLFEFRLTATTFDLFANGVRIGSALTGLNKTTLTNARPRIGCRSLHGFNANPSDFAKCQVAAIYRAGATPLTTNEWTGLRSYVSAKYGIVIA